MKALGLLAGLGLAAIVATAPALAGGPVSGHHITPALGRPPIGPDALRRANILLTPPAPANLHVTTDVNECGRHGAVFAGGILCTAVLPQGRLVLVWDWNGTAAIDGYRIYRTDSGQRAAIGVQTAGKAITLFVVPPLSNGYGGSCYNVVAYLGRRESAFSNQTCIGAGDTVKTVTLSPTDVRGISRTHSFTTGTLGSDKGTVDAHSSLTVGYNYGTAKSVVGDAAVDQILRLGLHFDLGSVMHKKIRAARLKLVVNNGFTGNAMDHSTSCTARIGYGTAYWWNYADWIDAAVAVQSGVRIGPDVSYDVTPLVASWTGGGRPNYGLVLLGEDENLNAFTQKECVTAYTGDIKLEIEFTER